MSETSKQKSHPKHTKVPVSQYHVQCLSLNEDRPHQEGKSLKKEQNNLQKIDVSKIPPDLQFKNITTSLQRRSTSEPDLRDSVTLWKDRHSGRPQYTTKWNCVPQTAPDLPLNVLKKVLFPKAFPSRILGSQDFQPQNISEVQHKGRSRGRSTSTWTEVAMHLVHMLEPGHY